MSKGRAFIWVLSKSIPGAGSSFAAPPELHSLRRRTNVAESGVESNSTSLVLLGFILLTSQASYAALSTILDCYSARPFEVIE